MRGVELSLAGWLELYNELCDAERLLAQSGARPDDQARLREDVARLQAEVDAALQAVNEQISARKGRKA
jgi:trans-2-enoyl-CoA reductase